MRPRRARLRAATAGGLLAAALSLPVTGAACNEEEDRDCRDFSSQEAAQEAYEADPDDPGVLDADDDGRACEKWPPGPGDPREDTDRHVG
ncbi:hypothetical protein [Streptomyces sp. JJ36]|uniref:hypothetical protein n=1 Tax=Streptomyces sp. JJ36 TaxID=2736645 RepID=UPI001F1DBAE9|nr:hypothetical protein [Streptomyces sp. JJ36]MCF6524277.1 hypothetical protein [Streptomyces sp. JJ36]